MKLIIALTGASGAIYGVRILELLKQAKNQLPEIETHLIMSQSALITIKAETSYKVSDVKNMADYFYHHADITARISSGSYRIDGMIIAPCSMKTLAAIACGYEENLIVRAASVMIKERKNLTLMTREVPLSAIHLENMLKLANLGVNISPPVPAFYNRPENLDDIINHSVVRALDLHGLNVNNLTENKLIQRWQGLGSSRV